MFASVCTTNDIEACLFIATTMVVSHGFICIVWEMLPGPF